MHVINCRTRNAQSVGCTTTKAILFGLCMLSVCCKKQQATPAETSQTDMNRTQVIITESTSDLGDSDLLVTNPGKGDVEIELVVPDLEPSKSMVLEQNVRLDIFSDSEDKTSIWVTHKTSAYILNTRTSRILISVLRKDANLIDGKFLEKALPYGYFSVNGKEITIHHGLLIYEADDGSIYGWDSDQVSPMLKDVLGEHMLDLENETVGKLVEKLIEDRLSSPDA